MNFNEMYVLLGMLERIGAVYSKETMRDGYAVEVCSQEYPGDTMLFIFGYEGELLEVE